MRSLGQFARVEELQDMLQEVDSDGGCKITYIRQEMRRDLNEGAEPGDEESGLVCVGRRAARDVASS